MKIIILLDMTRYFLVDRENLMQHSSEKNIPEDEGNRFIRNVGIYLSNSKASHSRSSLYSPHHENLKLQI
jgi:hypothetical protein